MHQTENKMEDSEEVIYINPNQYEFDVKQLVFETISLAIPSKRQHHSKSEFQCDEEMMVLLEKYTAKEKRIDPRWEELNKLKDLK